MIITDDGTEFLDKIKVLKGTNAKKAYLPGS